MADQTTTPARSRDALTDVLPWTIPDANCTNCGQPLAWCHGVGRIVIRHANGEDRCYPTSPTACLDPDDTDKARDALSAADAAFAVLKGLTAGAADG